MKVRLKNGPVLGEIEEYFVQSLTSGDHFIFAGRMLEYIGIKGNMVNAVVSSATEPKVPAYAGGRLPLSQNLADMVRNLMHDEAQLAAMPKDVYDWLSLQKQRSRLISYWLRVLSVVKNSILLLIALRDETPTKH